MEFGLLGPLEIRMGDGPLPLGRPKQQALLALLLLHANRVVSRERLIDGLWGEAPPETAVKAVQVYVSHLRKLLPAGTLVTRAPGYLLAVDSESVDLLRFERLVGEARSTAPARAASLLREALSLWRGPALEEFGEEPFARVERGRLEDLRLAALEDRIEADLALGRGSELTSELEALIAEHPQRERLRGQLMLALYRTGRQAEALAVFRDAQAALDEFGLEPSSALRQLQRQILTQDAALDPPRHELAAATGLPGPLIPQSPFPFVGRSTELALLRALLERAAGGEGGFVLLSGEAGAGKTRLIREFAHVAAADGVLVLYGTSDAAVSTPYQPLREWLEFMLRAFDDDALANALPTGAELLARLVPELERLTGAAIPAFRDAQSDRYLLHGAAVELLRNLGHAQPLLLVADDVQWADGESLHLLRRLCRTAPEMRAVVLAAYRDRSEGIQAELPDTVADLSRQEGVTKLSLGDLSSDDVSAFIRASAGAEASRELESAIGELSDGTPLFLCELWRELVSSGAVEVTDTGVYLSRPLGGWQGPERVRDLVQQRLSRLAPETVALLELAAAAGPRFELRVLSDAARLDQAALGAAVEEGVDSGMIEELPEEVPTCRFSHELVRRAVYDRVKRVRRAELHLRIGEALERVHAADPARVLPELAYHFTLGVPLGGAERAVVYNLRAGAAAIAAAAFEEAAARFSTALELGIDDGRERARVQVELSFVLEETGRFAESDAVLLESLDAATGLEERGVTANALVLRTARQLLEDPECDLAAVRAVAEAAIETNTELGDERGLADTRRLLALVHRRRGDLAAATAELERALVHADASGQQATRRRMIGSLLWALFGGPAPVTEAIDRCNALLEDYGNDRIVRALITRALSGFLAMAGRFDEAREHVDESSVVLDELNQLTPSLYRGIAAEAKVLIGDRAGAEQELQAMWLAFRDIRGSVPDGRAMGAAYRLAGLYCDEGRWDAAARSLSYGREIPEPTHSDPVEWVALRLAVSGRLAAHDGRFAEGVTLVRRAVEREDRSDRLNLRGRVWSALAEVQRAAGAASEAEAAVAKAIEFYEAKGNVAAAEPLRAAAADASS